MTTPSTSTSKKEANNNMTTTSGGKRRKKGGGGGGGGGGGNKGPDHFSVVNEAARIRISGILDQFQESHEEVYTFQEELSNHERAVVHILSRKFGMASKSSGKGKQRRVSVYKKKKSGAPDGKGDASSTFTFSEESRRALVDLFMHYPPGEEGVGEQNANKHAQKKLKSRGMKDSDFCRPQMSESEIAKKVKLMASNVEKTPKLKEIAEKRSKLPIAAFQDVITSTIADHQVVLIAGETGCGKTTQVPQYLLDNMWAKGEPCKIICTQPRRISAITVSERIAHERGENVGDTVGYKIRLDTKGGRNSSVFFCTNGVLLRVLISAAANRSQSGTSNVASNKIITELTHIIVDEIHERDRFSDFMLAILRDLLQTYPHLRLVLMSATIDAERFSQYFGGCPVIRVPGFTHPVKSFYLEEVLSILKTPDRNHLNATSSDHQDEDVNMDEEYQVALDEAIEMACSNEEFDPLLELISSEGTPKVLNYQHSSTGITPLMVFSGKGRVADICTLLSLGADCHLQARDGGTALDWAKRGNQPEAAEILLKHLEGASTSSLEEEQLLEKYMSNINPEYVDVVLIEQLLRKICVESMDGAILVFLPGWDDINKTRESLRANRFFKDPSKYLVLPLHSMVPSAEQKKVFKRPPPGCRKIILSTNMAETAVTIDDVVYVIDSGRVKEKSYDPYNNVSTLQSCWISKASAKQREGRAGRCQPGFCYHLYSKLRAGSFPEFQVPEIKRMPIEELCLQVKMLDPICKVEDFLKKTLDPPVLESIKNAVTVLQDIGALSHDEQLTELGEKLGSLPVHPLTSKMLLFAALLNCLDPALTLACAADYRDPFTLPMLPHEKEKAVAAKATLSSVYGGHSDQLAIIAAFDLWKSCRDRGQESRFCSEYFISPSTMFMLDGMRKQLQNELVRVGLIPQDVSSCSMNSKDPGIIRAVVVAGLYPMVGRLHSQNKNKRFTVETASSNKVRLHPHSLLNRLSCKESDGCPLLVYDEVTRADGGMYTKNCTIIGPVPLLLLSTEIVVAPGKDCDDEMADEDDDSGSDIDGDEEDGDEGEKESLVKASKHGEKIMESPDNGVTLVVDRWLSFESTAIEVAQVYCLRERLSAAIRFKVSNPRDVLPPALGASIYAIACLLSYDGLTGISLPTEAVDSLTSMVNDAEIGKSSARKKKNQAPNMVAGSAVHHSNHSHNNFSHPNKSRNQTVEIGGRHVQQSLPPNVATPMLVDPPANAQATSSRGRSHQVQQKSNPRPGVGHVTGSDFGPYGPRGNFTKRTRGNRSG